MKRLIALSLVLLSLTTVFSRLNPVLAAFPLNTTSEHVEIVGSGAKSAEPLTLFWTNSNLINWVCLLGLCNAPGQALDFKNGAIMSLANFSGALYQNQPASTYAFVVDTAQTLGFAPKTAYAQGVGFSGLSPLLPLWKVFRNIAYFLMAIVMVVIGFMVMLRKKIDPKTVVTVQNAIPRVIISLILITFSYAIVGIMIDLMYFVILLLTLLINSTGFLGPSWWVQILKLLPGNPSIQQVMTSGNIFEVFNLLFPGNLTVVPVNLTLTGLSGDIVGWMGAWTIFPAVAGAIVGLFSGLAGGPIGAAAGAAAGGAAGFVAIPIIVQLILGLALLFIFIRLVIMFLTSYINIVLALLIGPLQLLLEALPGGNGFESWFKNLFSNIIVFPISATMFLIAMFFMGAVDRVSSPIWSPPYGIVGGDTKSIAALFAIGVLAVIPTIVSNLQEAIKAKSPVPIGPGAIAAPFGGAVQTASGVMSQFYYGEMALGAIGRMASKFKK